MFNELMFNMITQLQLPCSVNHCFCHAYSAAVAMFNEMQLPCLMHCTSIGHVGMEMPMPIENVMQFPCSMKCSCHVY